MKEKKGLSDCELNKIRFAQSRAKSIAWEIADLIEVGMTEKDAYRIAFSVFKNHGLKYHWHIPYIGLGNGTNKLKSVGNLLSSFFQMNRKLTANDIIMVDIAPIIDDYPSDYTVSKVVGINREREIHIEFTKQAAKNMVGMVEKGLSIKEIFNSTKRMVEESQVYQMGEVPIINLGHRFIKLPRIMHVIPESRLPILLLFPGPSFINGRWNKTLDKLWAIEPYILSNGRAAKYEELIYVDHEFQVHRLNPD